jgi:cytochrome c oxidase subunit 2
VGKWWAVVFGGVMAAAALLFIVAPFVPGWWLPQGVSTHAYRVDRLFYIILGITGFFFILTEALLVVFVWQYAHKPGEFKPHPFGHHAMEEKGALWTSFFKRTFRPVSALLHDQHRVELAWTIVPAAILLYIAFAQVNTWADVKYLSRLQKIEEESGLAYQIEVTAHQFDWSMRYPSRERWEKWKKDPKVAADFARNPHIDDVHIDNQLHCWTNSNPSEKREAKEFPAFVVQLRTKDVLHSFNIPYMRVKQDSLPGKIIPVWFRPIKANTKKVGGWWEDGYNPDGSRPDNDSQIWEIPCAELCGWGHSRMIGRVYVHPSEEDFLNWLDAAGKRQNSHQRGTGSVNAR